uniref:Uncharacterized protein n=1 Tax=Panagrolaimus sp. ES5 TaxID=591445 RepID=A0AC34GVA8_9BILA
MLLLNKNVYAVTRQKKVVFGNAAPQPAFKPTQFKPVSSEGRDEFNKPRKNGPHVGISNREMAKHKDFRMVRQKIRGRNRQRS